MHQTAEVGSHQKKAQDLSKIPLKTLFSAPKDPQTFLTWKRVIPRKDHTFTKSSFLCEDHFAPSDILTHFNAAGSDVLSVSSQTSTFWSHSNSVARFVQYLLD